MSGENWVLSPAERRMMLVPCAACGAEAGQWCVTSGGVRTLVHRARYTAARDGGLL